MRTAANALAVRIASRRPGARNSNALSIGTGGGLARAIGVSVAKAALVAADAVYNHALAVVANGVGWNGRRALLV